jgi:Flp pilus assembly CpaF family ATPase
VEEIWINEPSKVFVARNGRSELTTTVLSARDVRDLVERMLKISGRRVDVSSPFVNATARRRERQPRDVASPGPCSTSCALRAL